MPIYSQIVPITKQPINPTTIGIQAESVSAHQHKKNVYSHAAHFCKKQALSDDIQGLWDRTHMQMIAIGCESFAQHQVVY